MATCVDSSTLMEDVPVSVSLMERSTVLVNSAPSVELYIISNEITSNTVNTTAYSSSVASLEGSIDTIIKNFDGYEYFLYFNSGSSTSYPKSNTEPPFILYPTSNPEPAN